MTEKQNTSAPVDDKEKHIKLDYTLETPEERVKFVDKLLQELPQEKITPFYLEYMTRYILCLDKKEVNQKKEILTDNHMVTVNKRETSFEGLVGKFENGEDGIYNMITNDKNILFIPKDKITEQDKKTVPGLQELCDAIEKTEAAFKAATGKKKKLLMNQLIQMRQDQYVLRNSYRQPIGCINGIKSFSKLELSEHITIDENGKVISDGIISLFNPKHISLLLCNYSKLKEETYAKFTSDSYYLIQDLEELIDTVLKKDYPLYFDLLIYKIDGKTNNEIQMLLSEKHGIKHSEEYISSLWRNKIPKLLAEAAEEQYLYWYYTEKERGKWKKCSRCGQIKLAHNRFFSKNKSSKDGFYSICKVCRNKKTINY